MFPCAFVLNGNRMVASFYEGGEAAPVVFLLHRAPVASEGWDVGAFWDNRGKYLLAMIFMVFFLKGFQVILDPPRSRQSLMMARALRAKRAGERK
jgi:hypothetical protein